LVTSHLQEVHRQALARASSTKLFDAFFRPVLPMFTGLRNIVIVADAPYHRVAFAGLWDSRRSRYLVEDHALVRAPSATAYIRALSRQQGGPNDEREAVLIESPQGEFDPLDQESHGPRNLRTLGYARADLRRGDAATPSDFIAEAANRDVVHLTAPILTNNEYPFLSRILLADVPGRKHSGAIFGRHLATTQLSRTKLVVLDNRGPSLTPADGPGTLAFSRVLLTAGVPSVVGSVADVKAPSVSQTWLDFHRRYASGLPVAESLRQAQLAALSESNHRLGPWAMLTVFGSTQ
jgi:CHAT domain-containing protein